MNEIKLCKSFKFLSTNLDKIINKKLKKYGLSMSQGVVLLWLHDASEGELLIKEIEKKFGTAQSTIFGVIQRLSQKGLVETYLSEQRNKIVKITKQGSLHIDCIKTAMMEADALVFESFTEGEKILFGELLRKSEKVLLQYHHMDIGEYYDE